VLFGGTMWLFSRAMQAGFVNYDDPGYVTENPHVQGGLSWAGAAWAFTGRTDYWHPLTWLSHMLDWELFGAAPWGHHMTSVLWHALNAVLAFFVFRRLAGGL
jgi:protein O-mannosyl-transferase